MNDSVDAHISSERVRQLDPQGAVDRLDPLADADIAQILAELGLGHAIDILEKFPPDRRARIAAATRLGEGEQWLKDRGYPEGSVGRLMEFGAADVRAGNAGSQRPLGLKRMGADPAMASSIFLTTATDVVSMGLFLGMAAWLVV